MKNIALTIALSAALPSLAVADVIPNSRFAFQAWDGAAYTSESTGKFSHCAISAGYVSGNNLHFSVNADATVSIGVSGDFGLRPNQEFPVALYVDRRAPFYGVATAVDESFASLTLTDFDAAMIAFKKGYNLQIEALGGSTDYSLKGTFRALDAALQCALENYEYGANVALPARDKTALFQLSAMILPGLGIDNFRYLSENELREKGAENTVSWEAREEGMSGAFLSIPYVEGQGLRETDSADTQFIAETCSGDYFTSARAIELNDVGDEARELLLICKADGTQSETYLTKFIAGADVVYTLIEFDNVSTQGNSDSLQRKKQSESAVLRAASFMVE
jgi:hypothetical protein